MPLFIRELHHLILNGGAVARSCSVDTAVVERRARDIFLNQTLDLRPRVCEPAAHLFTLYRFRIRIKGEGDNRNISLLFLHLGIVHGFTVHPRRCACFKSPHFNAK